MSHQPKKPAPQQFLARPPPIPWPAQAAGADPNLSDDDGSTALHAAVCACEGSGTEGVQALLGAGAKPNTLDKFGCSPMLLAAKAGRADVLTLLLRAGGCPNAVGGGGQSPLTLAARWGHPEAVRLLLVAAAR